MPVQISPQELNELRKMGYSDSEINQAISEIENEEMMDSYNTAKQTNSNNPMGTASHSSFTTKASDDIARWQLELNDILERAEHVLKGDIVVFENNQLIWKPNPNPEQNTLNENGVQLCMKLLSMYINRNTILSDFKDEEIRYKVLDFGKRFNDLIFLKYDEMGMDTEEKRKEYASLVGAMTDIVHSAYGRAKDGMERESFRKMINVNQASNGNNMMPQGVTVNAGSGMKTRGILNPMRYIAGKYT